MTPFFLTALAITLGPAGLTPGIPSALEPTSHFLGPINTQTASSDTLRTRWVIVPEDSEARYLVTEQLAGFDFPNDAVGATKDVSGGISLGQDGTIDFEKSEVRVQLTTLTSDNDRRDGYVGRRTLEVESHPEAVLVPRRFVDLPSPLPETGTVRFQLEADLTLLGVTRSTVWEVMASFNPTAITGLAKTEFPFEDFGISKPSVARVLSVDDTIRLELEFRMVPQGG